MGTGIAENLHRRDKTDVQRGNSRRLHYNAARPGVASALSIVE
jgi:hypothetical protein